MQMMSDQCDFHFRFSRLIEFACLSPWSKRLLLLGVGALGPVLYLVEVPSLSVHPS